MDCEQLDCRTLKSKPPTYRELYLRAHALYAQEEGKYQRLLHITRELAAAVPKGSKVLKDWKEWDKYEREKERIKNEY